MTKRYEKTKLTFALCILPAACSLWLMKGWNTRDE